ncbi:hypothetical protein RBSWK_03461 [Rhodopirellula baltica SWK14]|uniref:Uncharacterized protein n=1 Tax=Rhodopirellula baltica SWK14 TaxID=993516 RepID=L7CFJ4_RHOBT|nr:hypothetical protein RBSWK_03461 [Rhodopirellula baltica SWK14]
MSRHGWATTFSNSCGSCRCISSRSTFGWRCRNNCATSATGRCRNRCATTLCVGGRAISHCGQSNRERVKQLLHWGYLKGFEKSEGHCYVVPLYLDCWFCRSSSRTPRRNLYNSHPGGSKLFPFG